MMNAFIFSGWKEGPGRGIWEGTIGVGSHIDFVLPHDFMEIEHPQFRFFKGSWNNQPLILTFMDIFFAQAPPLQPIHNDPRYFLVEIPESKSFRQTTSENNATFRGGAGARVGISLGVGDSLDIK